MKDADQTAIILPFGGQTRSLGGLEQALMAANPVVMARMALPPEVVLGTAEVLACFRGEVADGDAVVEFEDAR